jgi:antitoxin (DNA-binding transcriptional repressor) of toxin-antitoxin stability system
MKQIGVESADLESCVSRAQQERLVITRKGRPVALVVGVQGMSAEQLELGTSDKFWKLIAKRRKQPTLSRATLERRINTGKLPRVAPSNEALQRAAQKTRRR